VLGRLNQELEDRLSKHNIFRGNIIKNKNRQWLGDHCLGDDHPCLSVLGLFVLHINYTIGYLCLRKIMKKNQVKLLESLIGIPSPSGYEEEIAEFIKH